MPDGGSHPVRYVSAGKMAEAIARAEQTGFGHMTPVLRAVAACEVMAVLIPRGVHDLSVGALKRSPLPALIIVQDDDYQDSGPKGFPAAAKALRWAKAHIIHGTGGQPEHYAEALRAARAKGSCCLVETSSARIDEWLSFARRAAQPRRVPTLVVRCEGGVHPVMGVRH